jgi:hypothetical protein
VRAWPMIRRCLDHQYWSEEHTLHPKRSRRHSAAKVAISCAFTQAGYLTSEGADENAYNWPGMPLMTNCIDPDSAENRGNPVMKWPIFMLKVEKWGAHSAPVVDKVIASMGL